MLPRSTSHTCIVRYTTHYLNGFIQTTKNMGSLLGPEVLILAF
jgi:hypothetical protein